MYAKKVQWVTTRCDGSISGSFLHGAYLFLVYSIAVISIMSFLLSCLCCLFENDKGYR